MEKEQYVSLETSQLLTEKGFDWDTDKVYERNIMACRYEDYPMPTQATACRWLREEKMIFISPFPTFKSSSTFKSMLPYSWRVDIKNCFGEELGGNYEYVTYEDSVEAALEFTLKNLI